MTPTEEAAIREPLHVHECACGEPVMEESVGAWQQAALDASREQLARREETYNAMSLEFANASNIMQAALDASRERETRLREALTSIAKQGEWGLDGTIVADLGREARAALLDPEPKP